MKKINLSSDLTLRNAFVFPLQDREGLRNQLIGGALLLIPIIGFILNMGYRLHVVHRMLNGELTWPSWKAYPIFFKHGLRTVLLIFVFHIPAFSTLLLGFWLEPHFYILASFAYITAFAFLLAALYVLPGFMTFYAHKFEPKVLLDLKSALGRVLRADMHYKKAWAISLLACMVSFLGLMFFFVGFAVTSVWFWQVAAFCFSSAFAKSNNFLIQAHHS